MVVWKGFGILNVFIVALFIAFVGYLSRLVGVDTDEHNWPLSIAVLLSGIIIWFLGKYLHNRKNHIVLIDAATGSHTKWAPSTAYCLSVWSIGVLSLQLSD